jgi:molybdopterin/thiamine biosynthesis adenylyltransferase
MPRTLSVVGLGNIGSHLVPHLARMPDVARVALIDKGGYDRTNIRTQAITPGEAGRSKARVQALRLKRINPALTVVGMTARVEDVPLGCLRGDAILACVDSRAARLHLNQAARHLGVPLVDAGVHPDGMLTRVSVFLPGAEDACLECTWDQADYDAIEQVHPCEGVEPEARSTGAPAHLGALAAAVQAIECERLLGGLAGPTDRSHEIVIDALSHRQHLTRFTRHRTCRLARHDPLDIGRLDLGPEDITVKQALSLGSTRASATDACLRLGGVAFAARVTCLGCGQSKPAWRLRRSIRRLDRLCTSCGGRLEAGGADIIDGLTLDGVPRGVRQRSLRAVGFKLGDVFSVRRGERLRFYELGGARNPSATRQEA